MIDNFHEVATTSVYDCELIGVVMVVFNRESYTGAISNDSIAQLMHRYALKPFNLSPDLANMDRDNNIMLMGLITDISWTQCQRLNSVW